MSTHRSDNHGNSRVIQVPSRDGDTAFPANDVTTSKYNLISFVPVSLFIQFRRIANVYFLGMGILMLIGTYTPLFQSPLGAFTTLFPLSIVLLLSMIQEGLADLKRHKSDREMNERKATLIVGGSETQVQERQIEWRDIRVGQFIKIQNLEQVPADVVVVATSEENGACFIESSNIDGETNLKLRRAIKLDVLEGKSNEGQLYEALTKDLKATFTVEAPNIRINNFEGNVVVQSQGTVPLAVENVLLRGSTVKNTKWVAGLVIYTGKDTKLVRNSRHAPSKMSILDRNVNRAIYIIFFGQVLLALISTLFLRDWERKNFSEHYYLGFYVEGETIDSFRDRFGGGLDVQTSSTPIFEGFLTFLVLYNNLIPISMYVTLETVIYILLYFISQDLSMYDDTTDTPAKDRSNNVTDLGSVQHIFSDKTGTLTQNVMTFRRAYINNTIYGAPIRHVEGAQQTYEELIRLGKFIQSSKEDSPEAIFCYTMALCNTVIVERQENGETAYQAESPDEAALVKAADNLGFSLFDREEKKVVMKRATGEEEVFKVLAINKFTSARKRMSVLMQSEDGKHRLYVKGADNVVLSLAHDDKHHEDLESVLSAFSTEGLRTLVYAYRDVPVEKVGEWLDTYHDALAALENREEKLAVVAADIETNLTIVGASAIEDQLQDQVAETIENLSKAGINFWMLTGDKRETAVNIGYSCAVLRPHMEIISIASGEAEDVEASLLRHYLDVMGESDMEYKKEGFSLDFLSQRGSSSRKLHNDFVRWYNQMVGSSSTFGLLKANPHLKDLSIQERALVVDGGALLHILSVFQPQLAFAFANLAAQCSTVIACRTSPKQKAELVKLVKAFVKPKPITLAIGDGANDVAMIQEAQVGIGISGREGQQAVNNSDFAISQFRFLQELVLVHGRWNYRRTAKVVLYSFYKNLTLVITLVCFVFLTGVSGTSFYEDIVLAGFNIFLFFPIISVGIFDRDLSKEYIRSHPEVYYTSRQNRDLGIESYAYLLYLSSLPASCIIMIKCLTYHQVLQWIVLAIWHGLVIFWLGYLLIRPGSGVYSSTSFLVMGTIVYTALVQTLQYKVLLITDTITHGCTGNKKKNPDENTCSSFGWTLFFWLFSVIGFFVSILIYNALVIFAPWYFGAANVAFSRPLLWLVFILIPVATLLVDIVGAYMRAQFAPTPERLTMEEDRLQSETASLPK